MTDYRIERLETHERAAFASGSAELDRYFREAVTQDVRRRVATCWVAVADNNDVAGYYTLAASSVPLSSLSPEQMKRLPRYAAVPAVLLGRLAVATAHQGRQLGAVLVRDALLRAGRADIGAHLMVVDAKDRNAERFYAHLGFAPIAGEPSRMVYAIRS